MTMHKRWTIALLTVATVMAAGADESFNPSDGDYQQRRERIEKMEPGDKKQLLAKKQRFLKLSEEKKEELKKLHLDLQAQDNREELERVLENYFEWVSTLEPSERSELARLTAQERIERVMELKAARDKPMPPPGGFGGFPRPGFGGMWAGRGESHGSMREYVEAIRTWAGRYTIDHADDLAEQLPPQMREKWKATLKQARSDGDEGPWHTLVPWYLAGPKEDPPISDTNIAEFEKLIPAEHRQFFESLSHDDKVRDLHSKLRSILLRHITSGSMRPCLKDLVSEEQLRAYESKLTRDQKGNLEQFPREKRDDMLRFFYFLSKLPSHPFDDRDGRRPFRGGGPSKGDPRRGGPQGPGRGPMDGYRPSFEGSQKREMRPDKGRPPMEKRGGEE